jgi:competence protein ComEC
VGHWPALPLVGAALASGTLAGAGLAGPWPATLAVGALAALAAVLAAPPGAMRSRAALLALAVLVAALGHARYSAAAAAASADARTLAGTHLVRGVVIAEPALRGSTARVVLAVERVDGEHARGRVALTLPAPAEPLRAGDRIEFGGRVEMAPRGHGAAAAYPERWRVVGRDAGAWPRDALRAARRWSDDRIARVLPEPGAALAGGMLLGAQRPLPDALTADLRATGTTHLVVASGQNVALLVGSAVALLVAVLPRRRAALVALLLLPGYVVIAGGEPPIVRAALMAGGVILANAGGRRTPGAVFLAYAAAVMLAVDPLLAADLSFQLSLAATAGVLLLAPGLQAALARPLRADAHPLLAAATELTAIALAAGLAVAPVQGVAFGELSLVQVPANVLVAPLYGAIVVLAAVALATAGVEPVAALTSQLGAPLTASFAAVVGWLARLPAASATWGFPPAAVAAWFAALGLTAWHLARRAPPPASRASAGPLLAGGAWVLALIAAFVPPALPGATQPEVRVLDVGHGLAVLLRDGDATLLVDVGPPDGAVLAALARAGVRRELGAVVLTHADADHAGGLAPLAARFEIGAVYGTWDAAPGAVPLAAGDTLRVGRIELEALAPAPDARGRENDRSLVLRVRMGARSVLLPADIGAAGEALLLASTSVLAADALVVPHHGSNGSSSVAFVRAVGAGVAIVAVGAGNRYGHPHPDALARYGGAAVLRTDLHGDVRLRSDGSRLWVQVARRAPRSDGTAGRARLVPAIGSRVREP